MDCLFRNFIFLVGYIETSFEQTQNLIESFKANRECLTILYLIAVNGINFMYTYTGNN